MNPTLRAESFDQVEPNRRTRIGPYTRASSFTLDQLNQDDLAPNLRPAA